MGLAKDNWGPDCGKSLKAKFRFNSGCHWELLKGF